MVFSGVFILDISGLILYRIYRTFRVFRNKIWYIDVFPFIKGG
jgi:hypothetical protein